LWHCYFTSVIFALLFSLFDDDDYYYNYALFLSVFSGQMLEHIVPFCPAQFSVIYCLYFVLLSLNKHMMMVMMTAVA